MQMKLLNKLKDQVHKLEIQDLQEVDHLELMLKMVHLDLQILKQKLNLSLKMQVKLLNKPKDQAHKLEIQDLQEVDHQVYLD